MFYFITFYSIFLRILLLSSFVLLSGFLLLLLIVISFIVHLLGMTTSEKKKKSLVGTVYIKLQRISKGNTATVLSEQFALCSGRNILKLFSFKILGHNPFSVRVKLKLNEFSLVK